MATSSARGENAAKAFQDSLLRCMLENLPKVQQASRSDSDAEFRGQIAELTQKADLCEAGRVEAEQRASIERHRAIESETRAAECADRLASLRAQLEGFRAEIAAEKALHADTKRLLAAIAHELSKSRPLRKNLISLGSFDLPKYKSEITCLLTSCSAIENLATGNREEVNEYDEIANAVSQEAGEEQESPEIRCDKALPLHHSSLLSPSAQAEERRTDHHVSHSLVYNNDGKLRHRNDIRGGKHNPVDCPSKEHSEGRRYQCSSAAGGEAAGGSGISSFQGTVRTSKDGRPRGSASGGSATAKKTARTYGFKHRSSSSGERGGKLSLKHTSSRSGGKNEHSGSAAHSHSVSPHSTASSSVRSCVDVDASDQVREPERGKGVEERSRQCGSEPRASNVTGRVDHHDPNGCHQEPAAAKNSEASSTCGLAVTSPEGRAWPGQPSGRSRAQAGTGSSESCAAHARMQDGIDDAATRQKQLNAMRDENMILPKTDDVRDALKRGCTSVAEEGAEIEIPSDEIIEETCFAPESMEESLVLMASHRNIVHPALQKDQTCLLPIEEETGNIDGEAKGVADSLAPVGDIVGVSEGDGDETEGEAPPVVCRRKNSNERDRNKREKVRCVLNPKAELSVSINPSQRQDEMAESPGGDQCSSPVLVIKGRKRTKEGTKESAQHNKKLKERDPNGDGERESKGGLVKEDAFEGRGTRALIEKKRENAYLDDTDSDRNRRRKDEGKREGPQDLKAPDRVFGAEVSHFDVFADDPEQSAPISLGGVGYRCTSTRFGVVGANWSRSNSVMHPSRKAPDRVFGESGLVRSATMPLNAMSGKGAGMRGKGEIHDELSRNTRTPLRQMSEMKVNEVVRNKEQREAMKASACEQCELFYASMARVVNGGPSIPRQICEHIKTAGRHRHCHTPPKTPESYWKVGWDSTQESPPRR